jgi:hypothetical protein
LKDDDVTRKIHSAHTRSIGALNMASITTGKVQLDKRARDSLNASLHEILFSAKVNGVFPTMDNIEKHFAFHGQLQKHEPWRSHLEFLDVFDIISDHIRSSLEGKNRNKNALNIKEGDEEFLRDVLSAGELAQITKDIKAYLFSFPRNYFVWFGLPIAQRWGIGETKISESVDLVEVPAGVQPNMPTGIGLATTAGAVEPQVFLRVRCAGFGAGRANTTAFSEATSTLKQVLMFAEGKFLTINKSILYSLGAPKTSACFINDVDDSRNLYDAVALQSSLNEYLSSLIIDEEKLQISDLSKGIGMLASTKKAETREEKGRAISVLMSSAMEILDCPDDIPDVARIKTALEWAFDSKKNDNDTLAFVQACIGLEALLGDDDKEEPLTARLADRCAYLLGEGVKGRDKIRQDFRGMYEVRSKLVHGRRAKLERRERDQLNVAQDMLINVINREAANLTRFRRKQEKKT